MGQHHAKAQVRCHIKTGDNTIATKANSSTVTTVPNQVMTDSSAEQHSTTMIQVGIVPIGKPEPLLNGSAGITALALVIALAVYLRNVSHNTQDMIEDTISKPSILWPAYDENTTNRLENLSDTRQIIEDVTPFMFGMAVAFGIRLLASLFPLSQWQQFIRPLLPTLDFVLLACLVAAITAMWRAHHKLKSKEVPIRHEMYRKIGQPNLIRKSLWDRVFCRGGKE